MSQKISLREQTAVPQGGQTTWLVGIGVKDKFYVAPCEAGHILHPHARELPAQTLDSMQPFLGRSVCVAAALIVAGGLWYVLAPFSSPSALPFSSHAESIELYSLKLLDSVAWDWDSSASLPLLTEITGGSLVADGKEATIGKTHSRGLLHRGVQIFVVDPKERFLMLQRHPEGAAMCPLAWELLGEHCSAKKEPWEATVRRALRDVLGVSGSAVLSVQMLGKPVLFRSDYSVDGGRRLRPSQKPQREVQVLLALRPSAPLTFHCQHSCPPTLPQETDGRRYRQGYRHK